MRTKQNWPQVIEEFHQSGKTKVAFCRDRGVSYQSFLMHFKRSQDNADAGFQQILVNSNLSSDRIDYYFTDGRCVSFPIGTSKEIMRFLVSL
jgi:hypothetical protein